MECQGPPGQLLRDAREAQGLSQRRLAIRAGTSQDAISRIERGVEAPTLERFGQLLLAMGLRPELRAPPLEGRVPTAELAEAATMSPAERLREASSWNRTMSLLAAKGEEARRVPGLATRRGAR